MCLHTKSKNKGEWRAVRKWSVNMFNHRVINFIMAGDFPYTKICTEKSVSTASLDDMSTAAAAALHPKKTQQHLSLARIKIQNNKYFFISWHNFSLVSFVCCSWACLSMEIVVCYFCGFWQCDARSLISRKIIRKRNYKFTARKCISSQWV